MKRDWNGCAARVPSGRAPVAYFPVRTPCAIGLHTIWPIPSRLQMRITFFSIPRRSIEYCGWFEIGA